MTVAVIVAAVTGVLLLISRFVQAAKGLWSNLPHWAAVLLPAIVSLIPSVVALLQQSKTWADLTSNLIGAAALVIVGLFPSHEPTPTTKLR